MRHIEADRALLCRLRNYFLGEVVLVPGGVLKGRVVDGEGTPIAQAVITARWDPLTESDLEREERNVWAPISAEEFPTSLSGDDGYYAMEGLPSGVVEVFAAAPGTVVGVARNVSIAPRLETELRALVLHSLDAARLITGKVQEADGEPVMGAYIRLLDSQESRMYKQVRADSRGVFILGAIPEREYTLCAYDPSTMRLIKVKPVYAGALNLDLWFSSDIITVSAHNELGALQGFRVLVDADSANPGWSVGVGLVAVERPRVPFALIISEPLHRLSRMAFADPTIVPPHIDAMLSQLGGVSGVVQSELGALCGAEVHAHLASEVGRSNGEVQQVGSVRSDGAGRFFLALPRSERFIVHAEASGYCRGGLEVPDFVDGSHVGGVVIHMSHGGSIVGKVTRFASALLRGLWVVAMNGDGHIEYRQTDGQGQFFFKNVSPGAWQVGILEPSDGTRRPTSKYLATELGEQMNITVRQEQTESIVIDLGEDRSCCVKGRLTFNGFGASGWNARIAGSFATVNYQGHFTLYSVAPGPQSIILSRNVAGEEVKVIGRINVERGVNLWELNLPTGSVVLEALPESNRPRLAQYALTNPASSWSATIRRSSVESMHVDFVPVGPVNVHAVEDGEASSPPEMWPILAAFDLGVDQLLAVSVSGLTDSEK